MGRSRVLLPKADVVAGSAGGQEVGESVAGTGVAQPAESALNGRSARGDRDQLRAKLRRLPLWAAPRPAVGTLQHRQLAGTQLEEDVMSERPELRGINRRATHMSFPCPKCGVRTARPLTTPIVDQLRRSGVAVAVFTRPAEADEVHDGPPLNELDAAYFVAILEQPGWEAELTG
jgi:hypothetical protein